MGIFEKINKLAPPNQTQCFLIEKKLTTEKSEENAHRHIHNQHEKKKKMFKNVSAGQRFRFSRYINYDVAVAVNISKFNT